MESGTLLAGSLRAAGFSGRIDTEAALAPYTTWRIGGPAEILAVPACEDDLAAALSWAVGRGLPWRVLGNGSNLLVSDEGVRGLVVRLRKVLDRMEFHGPRVVAGAGGSLPGLASACAARGLSGLEFAGGIPGTVGGGVIMNAGWHQYELGNLVRDVRFLEPGGRITRFPGEDCGFGYRTSRFRSEPGIVLSATLELSPGDADRIRSTTERFVESRKANQPTELPSCGSVFLKPPGDFAGRLIDAAGLKGLEQGGIQVSTLHANFFVNRGGGTARDVLALVARVEAEVLERFGVRLVREFEYWN